jgi:hypothetical protein
MGSLAVFVVGLVAWTYKTTNPRYVLEIENSCAK